jgi:hypothetical protein
METKEQLVKAIRDWVRIDNEMRKLKDEINIRKSEQKNISLNLIEVMRKNQIDEFDLNDGKIMYTKKNVKKPITQKILLDLLSTYYHGDIEKATALNEFIMTNRAVTEVETIVRKINKN